MASVIAYYAHPGHSFSQVNRVMAQAAESISDIEFVDLYAEYPRFDIDIDREQERLRDHDVIVFQFPMFWYSTPSLIKEWQDLVLEHGFAYGANGDALKGKQVQLAVSAAGPESAYASDGYQHHPIRTFLTPLEQTTRLCQMRFLAPYVLFGSLRAPETGGVEPHVAGYRRLLEALRDENYDLSTAEAMDTVHAENLPLVGERLS